MSMSMGRSARRAGEQASKWHEREQSYERTTTHRVKIRRQQSQRHSLDPVDLLACERASDKHASRGSSASPEQKPKTKLGVGKKKGRKSKVETGSGRVSSGRVAI